MQNQGTSLIKVEKRAIPDEILKPLLETSSCVGAAVVAFNEKLKKRFFKISRESGVTIDDMNALQVHFMENEVTFIVQRFEKDFHPDNQQPFSLLEDDSKQSVLLGFIEGNFTGREDPKHPEFSGEYNVAQLLRAKIAKIWNSPDVGKNVDKLMKFLATDTDFSNDMNLYHAGRGSIIMLGVNAEHCRFGTNPQEEVFEWGYMSKTLSEPKATAVEEAEAADDGESFSLKGASKSPAPATAATAPKDVATELKKRDETATAIPDKPKTEKVKRKVMWAPGPEVHGKNAIKKAYREKGIKDLPDKYMSKPEVEIEIVEEVPIKDFRELGAAMGVEPKAETEASKAAAPATQAKASAMDRLAGMFGGKKTEATAEPEPAKTPEPEKDPKDAPAENNPDINTKALPSTPATDDRLIFIPQGAKRDIALKFLPSVAIKKALDLSSNEVIDPKKIQEVESKYPDFMDQIGLEGGIERTFNWPHDSRVLLAKEYPHAAAVWIHSLIVDSATLRIEVKHLKEKLAKLEGKPAETEAPKTDEKKDEPKPAGNDAKADRLAAMFNRGKAAM